MYKLLLPLFALALLVGCTGASDTNIANDNSASSSDTTMDTSDNYNGAMYEGMHTVVLNTSEGDITLELDADAAPKTVTNFLELAKRGYYDDLTFHRVIPGFMIQGGDPLGNGTGGESIYGPTFEDEESGYQMEQGVIAMANRGANTNGSQFFIVEAAEGTPWLQGRHTIFGRVTEGMDVVTKIANVERDPRDMPLTPVTYTVEVVEQ